MKFKVDHDLCVGCGACEATCPEVFKLEDDVSNVILNPVPENLEVSAIEAEDGCPVGAISHD